MLGEAEEQLALNVLVRADVEDVLDGVADSCAVEHAGEGAVLHLQLVKHQFHLRAVVRHEVGLPLDEQVAVVAYVVNLLSGQLRHLGKASRSQYLLVHELVRIGLWLLGRTLEQGKAGLRCRLSVDGQQRAVLGQRNVGGRRLVAELDGEHLRGVGDADSRLAD